MPKRSVVIFIFTSFFIFSCSKIPPQALNPSLDISEQLLNIRIYRYGNLRFSGLMGITVRQGDQFIILLDASGIMLLKGQLTSTGKMAVSGGVKQITNSQLPQILAQSVLRIYSNEPAKLPCSNNGLEKICQHHESSGDWSKTSRLGPFPFWKVSCAPSKNGEYRYRQPWLGLNIYLTPISTTTQD